MMQSEDKKNINPDDFSRKVGEKLREHQIPVDHDVWSALENRLKPAVKRFPIYWMWAAASVAVIFVVLLFLFPFTDAPLITERTHQKEAPNVEPILAEDSSGNVPDGQEKKADPNPIGEEVMAPSESTVYPEGAMRNGYDSRPIDKKSLTVKSESSENNVQATKIVTKNNQEFAESVASDHVINSVDRIAVTELIDRVEVKTDGINERVPMRMDTAEMIEIAKAEKVLEPEENEKLAKIIYPEEVVNSHNEEANISEVLYAENSESVASRNRRGFHSLIASLGSGSAPLDFSAGSFDGNGQYIQDQLQSGNVGNGDYSSSGNGYYDLLRSEDYSDIEHFLPFSFSLTADFPVSNDVSLETGLSYTYLFSRFSKNENFIYKGTLQQHYIGIPVNLRFIVSQKEIWNIYLIGGGSVEKGIRSIYKQKIERNGYISHLNLYNGIDGFQLSVQGGAGISYRLNNNLNLFAEPRVIYYFKNNQPMSSRTDNPLIFGLNVGIRLQFTHFYH